MKARQKKGFSWTRLPADHFSYKFVYYDCQADNCPAMLKTVGAMVKHGEIMAMAVENGQKVQLLAPFSGVVEQIPNIDKTLELKGQTNVTLCMFRKCDHQPESQSSNLCKFCNEEVWAYEELSEVGFRRYDFKDVEDRNAQILWRVSINQSFSKGEKLGMMGESELQLDFRGRVTFLGQGQTYEAVILRVRRTICKHEKVYENICCYCSEFVENQSRSSVVAQSNGVVLSGRMVEKAEEQVIERLKENKKIILILDLDNTILHCMETSIYDTTVPINIPDSFYIIYMETLLVIKMRKYLRQFLTAILPLYEIYIYTKGTREYSQRICDYIRHTYTELFEDGRNKEVFTPKRIVSRNEDSDLEKKSIDIIFKKKGYIAIMDDRREVWGRPANAVSVKFFKFFDKLPNGDTVIPRVDDNYLYFAKDYMVDLHRRFYEEDQKEAPLQPPDFGRIVRKQRKQLLKQYRAIFLLSGEMKKNYHLRRAQQFGIIAVSDEKQANIIIFQSGCLTKQSKYYQNTIQLPLIHQSWLEYCYQYNYKFGIDMFQFKEGTDLAQLSPEQRQLFDEALFATHCLKDKKEPQQEK